MCHENYLVLDSGDGEKIDWTSFELCFELQLQSMLDSLEQVTQETNEVDKLIFESAV